MTPETPGGAGAANFCVQLAMGGGGIAEIISVLLRRKNLQIVTTAGIGAASRPCNKTVFRTA